jgi:hypothetical protein
MSLGATQVLLQFSVNPGSVSAAPASDTEIILTGFAPAANFGVPAAYFYALATLPSEITATQRYQMATGDALERVLTLLTTAINAGTIADSVSWVTSATPAINAAQAARRIAVLNVPTGSSTSLAPLGTVQLLTNSDTAPGKKTVTFSSTAGVKPGMSVSGPNIPSGTTVSAVAPNVSVTLSLPVSDDVPSGATVTFTPVFSTDLLQLIQAWLAFPTSVAGSVSS